MKEVLLSGKNLSKHFLHSGVQEQILNHIDIDIYTGDFTVIMGSSGAGKSTLLYALSGMDSITDGKVLYKGVEISKYNEKQMATLRCHEFGFVFQQVHLVSNLSLFENVAVAGYLNKSQTAKNVNQKANQLLRQMHIEKAKDRFPQQTSGGESQRAAIARAMINSPEILFADEPTGALNRQNTDEVLNLLTELNRAGQSILMVTHDLRVAAHCTRILYLEDGKIIDEMSFPAFQESDAKQRENKLSNWLVSLSW